MARGYWAYITPVEGGGGRPGGGGPVDPDWGVDEGGYPDQGLPGGGWGGRPPHVGNRPPGSGRPPHVGGGPAWPERPVDPGWGWGGSERPGHLPARPGRPVDPDYGVGEGSAGQLPVWPVDPTHPIAPPIPGEPSPPIDPPPGTIWPPLPPSVPEGKVFAAVLIASSSGKKAFHYVVLDIPPAAPDQGLPPTEGGEHPDQGAPPPVATPKRGIR
jgi:hypothetical protein